MENKRFAFVIYRQWAYAIFQAIQKYQITYGGFDLPLLITTSDHEFILPETTASLKVVVLDPNDRVALLEVLGQHQINVACFYGWSWIVKPPILDAYTCLCLHPSPLPRYRGGSPIQNQLVAGEDLSAVSVIKMNEGIDDGDLYQQLPFSLAGTLDEILARMIDLGIVITRQFIEDTINDQVIFTPQPDLEKYPPLKRRTPEQGEISWGTVWSYSALHNLVRGLADPYPNAYLTLSDGRLEVQLVRFRRELPAGAFLLKKDTSGALLDLDAPLALKVVEGYVLLQHVRFVPTA